MSSGYYSRRSRYGSTSYKDGGYVSDGGYQNHRSDSRLNKTRSLEDLTSTRALASNTSGVYSSKSLADVYGASSTRGNRLSSDARPTRRSYGSAVYGREAEDREGRFGRSYGSRENLNDANRRGAFDSRYASGVYRRGEIGGRADVAGREVSGRGNIQQQDSSTPVKYRISGEIVRETSDANLRGYYSDTGLLSKDRIDDVGYESEKAYGSKTSLSNRHLQDRRNERSVNWHSRSLERNNFESDVKRDRPRVGRELYGSDSRDQSDAERDRPRMGRELYGPGSRDPSREYHRGRSDDVMPGERRRPVDTENGPDSMKPRSRSSSPMRRSSSGLSPKIGSPNRRIRKGPYMSGGRGNEGELDVTAAFPVCSRWPNCTVCSIDIPNSQIVSINHTALNTSLQSPYGRMSFEIVYGPLPLP